MSYDPYLDYFRHLQGRSRLGFAYRRFYLYPRLCQNLRGRVLDVGCGIGDFLSFHGDAVGLDINPHTVRYCREQGLDAHLMEKDTYPFANESFDSVVLDNVLEHIVEPAAGLAEIRRVLRPRGRLLVGVPGRKGYTTDPDHKRFYDEQQLVSVLKETGFSLARLLYTPFRSAWLDRNTSQYCLYGLFYPIR